MQEIIIDTCKELEITTLTLILLIVFENFISITIGLIGLSVNAMPRRQAGLTCKMVIFMYY